MNILNFDPLLNRCDGEDVDDHENGIQYEIEGHKVEDAPAKCPFAKSVFHFQS